MRREKVKKWKKVGGRRRCRWWVKKMKNVKARCVFWMRGTLAYIGKKSNNPKRPQPTFQQSSAALLQVPTAQPPEKNGFFEGPSLTLCSCTDHEWREKERLHEGFRESCNKKTEPWILGLWIKIAFRFVSQNCIRVHESKPHSLFFRLTKSHSVFRFAIYTVLQQSPTYCKR